MEFFCGVIWRPLGQARGNEVGIVHACYVACNSLHFQAATTRNSPCCQTTNAVLGGRTDLVNSLVNGGVMWPEASVTYVTHALHVADIDGGMHAASTYT